MNCHSEGEARRIARTSQLLRFFANAQNDAFTLAEVLITLVIIGIIAAITVPTLITKYQKEQTVTQLKKAYSELSQAVQRSEITNGHHSTWDFNMSSYNFALKYLTPYIKMSTDSMQTKLQDIKYYNVSGAPMDSALPAQSYNTQIINLPSGSQLYLANTTSGFNVFCKGIYIDINGYKKPNKFGRDIFVFFLLKEEGVVPDQWTDDEIKKI